MPTPEERDAARAAVEGRMTPFQFHVGNPSRTALLCAAFEALGCRVEVDGEFLLVHPRVPEPTAQR